MPPKICLCHEEHWQRCSTKAFKYDNLKLKDSSEALTLEHLRELTSLRAKCVSKAGASEDLVFKDWTSRYFEEYLTFLASLADSADSAVEGADKLTFEYTSPLAGQPTTFHKLKGLQSELAMALLLYGSALRQQAYDVVTALQEADIDALREDSTDHVAAATLFRRAAGVFSHVKDVVLAGMEDLAADRPAEVQPSMVDVLRLAALGEAQAVTANRAELRGTSPALVAALHMGASDLFEEAAGELKAHTGEFNTVSEALRKFLALSSTLHDLRAWKAWAAHELAEQNAGLACACLQAAQRCIHDCMPVVEDNMSWRAVFQDEAQDVEKQMQKCDLERRMVYFQTIAKQPSKRPAGKVIVTAIQYQPKQLVHSVL